MPEEKRLIQQCQKGRPAAQRQMYERYAPFLLGVVRRYVSSVEDAEEVMSEAIFKVLTKIGSFDFHGSFEGWVRRIGINEALMYLRRKKQQKMLLSLDEYDIPLVDESVFLPGPLEPGAMVGLLDQLPTGYRAVFNLYVMDGYKHREIAEMLGISIHTSKSQLIMAKKKLKALVEKHLEAQKKREVLRKKTKYNGK